jgi:two-component system, LytTR family, sensor kinase
MDTEKKYFSLFRNIFLNRYFWIHTGYWIFYILFFTVQRFAFYGYNDFVPNLKLNLVYLPSVLIFTYIISEYVVPDLFRRKNQFIPVFILILIILLEPIIAYLIRIVIIVPFIYNDHRVYTLYNYLTAILIFVFGAVPVAGWKVARLLQSHYLHLQKVEHDKLEAELKLKETELKLLKGQIQPHFLFNTLNNLYLLALEKSDKTPDLVLRLSELLSYITYDCSAEKISLDKEIEFINSFIELERIRYETCDITLKIEGETNNLKIAPMILHTFIDNSFKHGAEKDQGNPWIKISIDVKENILSFIVKNSTVEYEQSESKVQGIGIANARKRLDLIYPERYELEIDNSDESYSVFLKLEL